jgi:hypothetical protein
MGYEVRLILGEISSMINEKNENYFSVAGSFDLCKVDMGIVNDIAHGKNAGANLLSRNGSMSLKKVYFYEGNEEVREDCYGDPLYAVDPALVIQKIKEMREEDKSYRRLQPAIDFLESMSTHFGEYHVVLFGH